MDIIMKMLVKLGIINGRSLDGALGLLAKIDEKIEAWESNEREEVAKRARAIAEAEAANDHAEREFERAAKARQFTKNFR